MFTQNKKLIFVGSIIVGVLILLIIGLGIYNRQPASVQLISTPSPIDVFINNQHFTTPTTIKLTPGTYVIWGSQTGYLVSKKQYKIGRGSNTINIKLDLDPEADYPPEGAPK